MAVVGSNIDEEEDQGAPKAPISTISTGGGGVGGGKVAAGPTQGGTPAQSANPEAKSTNPAGTFTNLQNYINENPNAGSNIGNQITGQINSQFNQGTNAINQGVTQFNQDVTAGTPTYNQDFINSALANPATFASNPNNVTEFQNDLNATYTGPTSLQNDFGAYNTINQGVTNAQNIGNQAATSGGREALLSQNAAPGTNETGGDLALNNFFVQSSPTAMNNITNATAQLSTLPNQLQTAQQNALGQIANAQTTAQNTAAQTGQAVQGAYTGLENNINQAVTAEQAQAQTNLAALQTALATNQPLTVAQQQELGMTPAQYQALQTLASQYGTAINPANNLDLLGAENLTQTGSTANLLPTGTAQTQPGGLLSSLLSTGSTAVGGAELAALINTPGAASTTLSSLGLSSIAQSLGLSPSSTVASLSVPQAQSLIEDLPADSNLGLDSGDVAANALDVGNTATSVADTAADTAASGISGYLPYIGAALSVGQILSSGEIGNGQGGISGALTGAAQGASIGALAGPWGALAGAVIGAIMGGLMGSTPTVGPNGFTGISVSQNGQLQLSGQSGADNGASVSTTNQVAEQATQVINQLMASNNLMLNPELNGQNIAAIVQGNAGTDNIGQANSAAGLWAVLVSNNAIVPNPNGTATINDPLNFSSYVTAQQPSVVINAANVATPQQYANLAALNQLSGQNNQFLLPANASEAGTAQPNIASFNYNQANTDLNQDLNTYNTNQLSTQQQALAALQAGIQGGGSPYNDQNIQNLINGAG